MQTGDILVFVMIPFFLEGCCVRKHHKDRIGLQPANTAQHYRAVEGDIFMMWCLNSLSKSEDVVWFKNKGGNYRNEKPSSGSGKHEEDMIHRGNNLKFPAVKVTHSGKYTCRMSGRELFFHLQVVEKSSLECTSPEESSATLILGTGGEIHCPGFTCSDQAATRDITWYKGNKSVSELQKTRDSVCEEKGVLHLCYVYEKDTAVYFCDTQTSKEGVTWTIRRAVNATALPQNGFPRIIRPYGNETEEVELGQSHTLTCSVSFGFEKTFPPMVQWYVNTEGKMEEMESQQQGKWSFNKYLVTQTATINKVTLQHLNHTYTCIAHNSIGNSSATIKLRKKSGEKWPTVIGYPAVSLLLLAGLGIILYVKWLEVTLIYRSHCRHVKCTEEEKDFDVFLSYVWSTPTVEAVGGFPMCSPSAPDIDEEASSTDQLKRVERCATHWPLEVLLPQVLEDQWGYHLCLLERDLLPGGVYTNDVVHAIQRSRMLLCLVSADYLCNSNAVFVLESGIQALLQDSHIKLLVIWINRTSVSFSQLDPPLPSLVQRGLKVLPSLDWTSGKPARATGHFWKSLKKAMPARAKATFTETKPE